MTPQYILTRSLCRAPSCAGPYDKPFAAWSQADLAAWRQRAQSEIEGMDFARSYGEPGYSDPLKGILFANWNLFPKGIDTILETIGFTLEWSDEWLIDYSTGKAYRISAGCYSNRRWREIVDAGCG